MTPGIQGTARAMNAVWSVTTTATQTPTPTHGESCANAFAVSAETSVATTTMNAQ